MEVRVTAIAGYLDRTKLSVSADISSGRAETCEIEKGAKAAGRLRVSLAREVDIRKTDQTPAQAVTVRPFAVKPQVGAKLRRATISIVTANSLATQREAEWDIKTALRASQASMAASGGLIGSAKPHAVNAETDVAAENKQSEKQQISLPYPTRLTGRVDPEYPYLRLYPSAHSLIYAV
ncbi:hypothetical protein ACU8V1_26285 (plasmid) [Rhizobium leguminosarum]